MIAIGIRQWRTHYHAAEPLQAGQVAAWNASLADVDLSAQLASAVQADEWVCIRSLRLRARLRAGDGRVQAGEAWRDSLAAVLLEALRNGESDGVVRYRDRRDAIADLLYRAAAGDVRRAWAWRQVGLISSQAPERAPGRGSILGEGVAALAAEPLSIWPVLTRVLLAEGDTGAWSAIVRALGPDDWDTLLDSCPQARRFQRQIGTRAEGAVDVPLPRTRVVDSLCAWIAAHPWQAMQHRRPLTVLLAAAAWPTGAAGIGAASITRMLCAAAAALARLVDAERASPASIGPRGAHEANAGRGHRATRIDAVEAPGESRRGEGDPDAARAERQVERTIVARELAAEPDGAIDASPPPAPPLPSGEQGVATEWAGLVFLVNLLPATAVLSRVAELDTLHVIGGPALPHVLHRVAHAHLGIPVEDAAIRAFCGGWEPGGDAEEDACAPIEAIAAATARELRELLAARLPELDPAQLIDAVCRRPGTIRFEPGWIEVRMGVDRADARLRRAALDLDPGWVPWLGCVVRFIYE